MFNSNPKNISVSIIVTTFNRPDALELVLNSLAKQIHAPNQVIVADDGSNPETTRVINKNKLLLPLEHSWQPNIAFRAARSRNLAICKVKSDYTIFIDGDCIAHPRFTCAHLYLARPGKIVAGSRALMNETETMQLLNSRETRLGNIDFRSLKFLRLPLGKLRDLSGAKWQTVRSCNMGIFTQDLLQLGGFDEKYIGWGREDSDFVVRALKNGLRIRNGRFAACLSHLFHKNSPRDSLSQNDARFNETLTNCRRNPIVSVLVDL